LISAVLAKSKDSQHLILIDTVESIRKDLVVSCKDSGWKSSLQEAITEAKKTGHWIIVAVLGGKHCPWSEKLTQDVLFQESFLQPLEKEFIFYPIDLSNPKPADEIFTKEKDIREVPLLLILNAKGEEISRVSYLPLGPEAFSSKLLKISSDAKELEKKLLHEHSDAELEAMYTCAKEIGSSSFKKALMNLGIQRKKNLFFMLERYREFLQQEKTPEEIAILRSGIHKLDPKNKQGTLRKLAIIDFEEKRKQQRQGDRSTNAIRPLTEYLKNFGDEDKENSWKIEMMIAQFLFSKNHLKDAIHHAEASFKLAPHEERQELGETLNYLREKVEKEKS